MNDHTNTMINVPEYYERNGNLKLSKTALNLDGEKSTVFQQPGGQALKDMEQFRNQGILYDVTLIVDDQYFSGHRAILAARIPYFKTMFMIDMREREQNDITIKGGIDAKALSELCKYAYTGTVDINTNNVQSLIFGSSFLQLTDVKDACANFLMKWLHPDYVFSVRYIAEILICPQLVQATNEFISQYFVEVSATKEFLLISADELIHIVKQDELGSSSEEQIFEAIMRWIRVDTSTRNLYIPQLLACVRLSLLNPYTFLDKVATDALIKSFSECRDLLDEARDYHFVPAKRPTVPSFKTRHPPKSCGFFFFPNFNTDGLLNIDGSGSEAVITFEVNNFCKEKLSTKIFSPSVIIRKVPWKISVQHNDTDSSLAYFVECEKKNKSDWYFANIQLKILSRKKEVPHFTKGGGMLFFLAANKEGYSDFASWNYVLNPENGYIKDGIVVFQAHIIVNRFKNIDWDSKKRTGFVGLKSEGKTFYLNSLLQSLYFINKFKKIICDWPQPGDESVEREALENAESEKMLLSPQEKKEEEQEPENTEDTNKDATRALQEIFRYLSSNEKAVQIDGILSSLLLGEYTYKDDNVETLLVKLLNQLKNENKTTRVGKVISQLFEGKMQNEVKNMESLLKDELKKPTTFSCIQLNIKKCKNVYEAFQDVISNENEKIEFLSFPPVLFLHLPRYNLETDYDGRFEFYEQIKLDPYLQRLENTPANYMLYSVFGKFSDVSTYTFINAKGNGEWYKFHDETVTKATKREAIEFNYGGEDKEIPWYVPKWMSAYMLVYVRDSEWKSIFA